MNDKGFRAYSGLATERVNPRTCDIDRISVENILLKINDEDMSVPGAVRKSVAQIAKAARLVSESFLKGKKIFLAGAGTSGRLAVLEAAEMRPTFGVRKNRFVPIIAGGRSAVFSPREGVEDDFQKGYGKINAAAGEGDVVIAIAASGVTPFARGAALAARRRKARCVFITTNPGGKVKADAVIRADIGPEVLSGSTRMKSGTATKLILNMITTSAMIISGKVYKNWMVDLKPTSRKLLARAERITADIAGISPRRAKKILAETKYDVKTAVVMAKLNVKRKTAARLLRGKKGFLKDIIE